MTPLRDCRDTFLHFLSDNLSGITVHPLRCDPNDPGADVLMMNAVNVQYLNVDLETVATQQVVIDIVNDDENTAIDWMTNIWQLLRSAFYTTLYSYTDPSLPVYQESNVFWDRNAVKFRRIVNENYTHYSCVLPLKFTAVI